MLHLIASATGGAVSGLAILVALVLIAISMALTNETAPAALTKQHGAFRFDFTAGDGSGIIASCANPENEALFITRAICVITTPSTGASTLDIGIGATAATANDTLIDGLSGATAGAYDNVVNKGTNGLSGKAWGASEFLTMGEASGDVAGLVGYMLLEYKRVGA